MPRRGIAQRRDTVITVEAPDGEVLDQLNSETLDCSSGDCASTYDNSLYVEAFAHETGTQYLCVTATVRAGSGMTQERRDKQCLVISPGPVASTRQRN